MSPQTTMFNHEILNKIRFNVKFQILDLLLWGVTYFINFSFQNILKYQIVLLVCIEVE